MIKSINVWDLGEKEPSLAGHVSGDDLYSDGVIVPHGRTYEQHARALEEGWATLWRKPNVVWGSTKTIKARYSR